MNRMGDWTRYFQVVYRQHFPRLNTPEASLEDFVEVMRDLWTMLFWAVQESTRSGELQQCRQKMQELMHDLARTPAFRQYV